MATVRDVAQVAGVSMTTVSRVLRGEPHVRPEVRQAVRAAVDDLQYRPSTLARQFREQRSRVVGYVVPDISEPFYAGILRGVEKALRPQGFIVAILDTDERASLEAEAVASLLDSRAAGLIVASSGPWPQAILRRFEGDHVPLVAIDNLLEGLSADAVFDDNRTGARLLTHHLAEHGHTRIAFVGGILTEFFGCRTAGRLSCGSCRGGSARGRAPHRHGGLATRQRQALHPATDARAELADGHRRGELRRGTGRHAGGALPRHRYPRRPRTRLVRRPRCGRAADSTAHGPPP